MNFEARLIIFSLAIIIVCTTSAVSGVQSGRLPPYFVQQPPNGEIQFLEAINESYKKISSIEIPCEAKGDPAPTYFWTKNGQLLNWTSESDRISQENGKGTLKIQAAKASDAGQYQCFAENYWGIATSNSVFVRKIQLSSSIKEEPIVKRVIEGQPFHLTCNVPDIYPKSSVTWYKQYSGNSGLSQIHSPRITIDTRDTIWFSNITQEDTGKDIIYACQVLSTYQLNDKVPRHSRYIRDKVILELVPMNKSSDQNLIAPVTQYTSGENEIAVAGEKVVLYCIFGGTPLPTVTWYKNGEPVRSYGYTELKDNGKAIEIDRLISSDRGNYTCKVSNGVGDPIHHTTALKILGKPSFITPPKNITIAEEETVQIHCEATGNPAPEITWIHNGKPLSEAPFNQRRTVSSNSITIEKLQIKDTGNYGCNATNSLGYVYQDVYLNVTEGGSPTFEEIPEDEETAEGGVTTLPCRAKGFPKPRITWFKNDIELTNQRHKTTIDEDGELTIERITFADAGKYTCSAQNRIAKVNAIANLVVRKPTKITVRPSDTRVTVGETAVFRCSAEGDPSSELTINWLRYYAPIDFSSQQRFVQEHDNSLKILSVNKADYGMYTCEAKTRADQTVASATLFVQDIPKKLA